MSSEYEKNRMKKILKTASYGTSTRKGTHRKQRLHSEGNRRKKRDAYDW